MSSASGIIASFSKDVRNFAFQTKVAQKNVIDIYPLDAANDYSVKSSLVSHIDYEINELKASDIVFSGWCTSSKAKVTNKVKRRHDDEENLLLGSDLENFYINGFSDGKIVVFSSGGKQIVNIIQLKRELQYACTEGPYIWIIDSDNIIKKFVYNQSKPLKSFKLSDLVATEDANVESFQVLQRTSTTTLAVAFESHLCLIDPSKRSPALVAKYEATGCVASAIFNSGKFIALGTAAGIAVYDCTSGDLVKKWDEKVTKLELVNDIIVTLNASGEMSIFKMDDTACICKIKTSASEIIGFTQISESIMIAWLNVNEPNFKIITLSNILNVSQIIVDEETEVRPSKLDEDIIDKVDRNGDEEETINKFVAPLNVSPAEQDELTRSLLSALDSPDDYEQIHSILLLTSWSESRIKSFVATQIETDVAANKLLEATIIKLQENPWEKSDSISLWLKWLLTLKGHLLNGSQSKVYRRQLKQMKSALKPATDSLITLLGIQGRLEMLKKQEQMREELSKLKINGEEAHVDIVEEGEAQGDVDESDYADESVSYANGESDTFVDAVDYRN